MFETPQTFASKAALIDVLKRNCGELTRQELLSQASHELQVPPEVVASALLALLNEAQVASVIIDGEERLKLTPS